MTTATAEISDTTMVIEPRVAGQSIYRRNYSKRDGRDLLLYGYTPHNLTPLPEDFCNIAKGGELRHHPLRDEWNIYAAHRQNRTFKPSTADDPLAPSRPSGPKTEIPFSDFELAVFENKFTSLHNQAPVPTTSKNIRNARAKGRCDVVVYGPESSGNLFTIGQEKRRLLTATWIDRYQTLFNEGHKFVMPFENRGDEVGVTLHHPHGQIYAFPFIPNVQAKAANAFRQGYDLSAALNTWKPTYKIGEVGGLMAFCPPYARFPYEVWVAPQRQVAGPWDFTETEADAFAHLLGDITRKYDELFQRPTAYMLSLHAAPLGEQKKFHFTAQFYPLLRAHNRVKYLASVEQSTDVFTVDVMPEKAANVLRDL